MLPPANPPRGKQQEKSPPPAFLGPGRWEEEMFLLRLRGLMKPKYSGHKGGENVQTALFAFPENEEIPSFVSRKTVWGKG